MNLQNRTCDIPKTIVQRVTEMEARITGLDSEFNEISEEAANAEAALKEIEGSGLNGHAKPAIKLIKGNLERAKARLVEVAQTREKLLSDVAALIEKRDAGQISEKNREILDALVAEMTGKVKAPAGYFVQFDFNDEGNIVYRSVSRKMRMPRGAAGRKAGKRYQWVTAPDLAQIKEWSLSGLKPSAIATEIDISTVHPTYNALIEAVVPGFTKRFKRGGEAAPRAGKDILASMIRAAGGSYQELDAVATGDTGSKDDADKGTTDQGAASEGNATAHAGGTPSKAGKAAGSQKSTVKV